MRRPENGPGGHSHRTAEEISFVLSGEIRIKLGDQVETRRQYDAGRFPPATVRAARNDAHEEAAFEEAAFVVTSVRVEDVRSESQPQDGFWPAEAPAHPNS